MDKKTENLLSLVLRYNEKNGSYNDIVDFIENNYKKYKVWDNFPITKLDFDCKSRNFVLEKLATIEKELVVENIEWGCIFIKSDNRNGIMIHYAMHRIYVVSGEDIETYVFTIKYDEE